MCWQYSLLTLDFPPPPPPPPFFLSGRRLTASGRRDLDRIASQIKGGPNPKKSKK